MDCFQEKADGLLVKIYVQPKSSVNQIVGLHGDALKVRLTAPPVDGAANKMCVKFMAQCAGVPKSAVEILSGHASRTKQVMIHLEGADVPAAREKIERRIAA